MTTVGDLKDAIEKMEKETGFKFYLNEANEVVLESDTDRVFMAAILTQMTFPEVPVIFYKI